jgi:cell division protein FtsW (lipid II flippase)
MSKSRNNPRTFLIPLLPKGGRKLRFVVIALVLFGVFVLALGIRASMYGAVIEFLKIVPIFVAVIAVVVVSLAKYRMDPLLFLLVLIPAILLMLGQTVQSVIAANDLLFDTNSIKTIMALLLGIALGILYQVIFCQQLKLRGKKVLNLGHLSISRRYLIALIIMSLLTIAAFSAMAVFGSSEDLDASISINLPFGAVTPAESGKFLYLITMIQILCFSSLELKPDVGLTVWVDRLFGGSKLRIWLCLIFTATCSLLLVVSGELGSMLIMMMTGAVLLVSYAGKLRDLCTCVGIIIPVLVILALALQFFQLAVISGLVSKVAGRIDGWLYFLSDPDIAKGQGHQYRQALESIYYGGLFGGDSRYYSHVSVPASDMVFVLLVQVFGMVVGLFVVFLFFAYTAIAVLKADAFRDYFDKGIVFGGCTMITLQAFYQIAASSTLLPITGNNVPFVSSGNTSLLFTVALTTIIFLTIKAKGIDG